MSETSKCSGEERGLCEQVARIHFECINQGFLHTLGISFLTLLYESIESSSSSILIVEKSDGRVIGFVAGGDGMGSIYKRLFGRWHRLVLALLPCILSFSKTKQIIEILHLSKKRKQGNGYPKAELLSIAVLPEHRSAGVAAKLYKTFCEKFHKGGKDAFSIIVGDDLKMAHKFYSSMGASPIGKIEVHEGKSSTVYKQELPRPS